MELRTKPEYTTRYGMKTNPWAPETLWGLTVPPVRNGTNPHNFRVNGTRNTVTHLYIQLRKCVCYIKQKGCVRTSFSKFGYSKRNNKQK